MRSRPDNKDADNAPPKDSKINWRRWTQGNATEIPFGRVGRHPQDSIPQGMVYIPPQWSRNAEPAEKYNRSRFLYVDSGFFMDVTEVTFALWKEVRDWGEAHGYRFRHRGNAKGDKFPVAEISWLDCAKWCNARSEMLRLVPCYRNDDGSIYRFGEEMESDRGRDEINA